jgi:pyridinium-3,5-bisthiocarboxylic acid mononucleotide nickel chelatase
VKIAYFDCQFGAAGDMLLGALLAAGVPFSQWQEELAKLALPPASFSVELKDVMRCSINSNKVIIRDGTDDECAQNESEHGEHTHAEHTHAEHAHAGHTHAEHTDAEHTHAGYTDAERTHIGHAGHAESERAERTVLNHRNTDGQSAHSRNLKEILQLIEESTITTNAKSLAAQIFTRLGQAEAKIHGVPLSEVHFHEVGAIDSIVDIVGFAIAYDMLQIERSYVSALPLGSGTVRTRHGLFPVPAPATVLLLSEAQARISDKIFNHECLTPTGAAILATIASEWRLPAMEKIDRIGYGAGRFNPSEFPNVCRVFLAQSRVSNEPRLNGEQKSSHLDALSFNAEIVVVLEANLDDLSPQAISFAMDRLFEAGALDVSVLPATMKKGRSGHLLSIICDPSTKAKLERIVLTQTSSLGVRSYLAERLVAEREWQEVTIGDGAKIRIKIARDLNGNVINAQPEYDDCAAYATATGIPLKEVIVDALTNLKNIETKTTRTRT